MDRKQLLKEIKKAMRGELDSINLYENGYQNANDNSVKSFFQDRVKEEQNHYNYLLKYYQEISDNATLSDFNELVLESEGHNQFISDDLIQRITGNQILFSSISTAVLLEKNAMDHYRACSESTQIPELKNFFQTMYTWEVKHYEEVLQIQEEAEEDFWTENRFQPF